MDCRASRVSPESVLDVLLHQDNARKTVRVVGNSALLMPLTTVLELLHTSLEETWAAARKQKTYLPVPKTMAKLLQTPSKQLGRGSLLRLLRAPTQHNLIPTLLEQLDQDYLWLTGNMWTGLFSSGFFVSPAASDFWIKFTQEVSTLNAQQLDHEAPPLSNWNVYACSPLVKRFGCPAMRTMLDTRLSELNSQPSAHDDSVLLHAHFVDQLAVLMRILAWYVADIVVEAWEMIERDNMENTTPLDTILPRFNATTSQWSNPIESALESIAKRAGWKEKTKARTFLGKLWANNQDPSSRIRLMRNWVQLKKGRPKFCTFLSLANVILTKEAALSDLQPEGLDKCAWFLAATLRVAETLALLLDALIKIGITEEQITAIMDAYRVEYRYARDALGKPMAAADTK